MVNKIKDFFLSDKAHMIMAFFFSCFFMMMSIIKGDLVCFGLGIILFFIFDIYAVLNSIDFEYKEQKEEEN